MYDYTSPRCKKMVWYACVIQVFHPPAQGHPRQEESRREWAWFPEIQNLSLPLPSPRWKEPEWRWRTTRWCRHQTHLMNKKKTKEREWWSDVTGGKIFIFKGSSLNLCSFPFNKQVDIRSVTLGKCRVLHFIDTLRHIKFSEQIRTPLGPSELPGTRQRKARVKFVFLFLKIRMEMKTGSSRISSIFKS